MSEEKIVEYTTRLGNTMKMWVRPLNDEGIMYEVAIVDEYLTTKIPYSDGDVFIDIGANIGEWAICMAVFNSTFKIYAYEPVEDSFRVLKNNIKLNNLYNVEAFKSSIHDVCCNTFTQGGINPVTIEQIFISNNIQKCKVLKMDCEGCECLSIPKTPPEILQKIDYLIGEFHPLNMGYKEFYHSAEPFFVDVSKEWLSTYDINRWRITNENDAKVTNFFWVNRKLHHG